MLVGLAWSGTECAGRAVLEQWGSLAREVSGGRQAQQELLYYRVEWFRCCDLHLPALDMEGRQNASGPWMMPCGWAGTVGCARSRLLGSSSRLEYYVGAASLRDGTGRSRSRLERRRVSEDGPCGALRLSSESRGALLQSSSIVAFVSSLQTGAVPPSHRRRGTVSQRAAASLSEREMDTGAVNDVLLSSHPWGEADRLGRQSSALGSSSPKEDWESRTVGRSQLSRVERGPCRGPVHHLRPSLELAPSSRTGATRQSRPAGDCSHAAVDGCAGPGRQTSSSPVRAHSGLHPSPLPLPPPSAERAGRSLQPVSVPSPSG